MSAVIHIKHMRDFDQFGINVLTGEACNVGARMLCDLTHQGKRLICQCFGLPLDCQFAENWNSRAIASIMLPYGVFQELAPLILLLEGYQGVVRLKDGECIGWKPEDQGLEYGKTVHEFVAKCQEIYGDKSLDRTFHINESHPRQGLSNVHQMSGRTA